MAFSPKEVARLRWACRRGMLELDLLLLPFFENQFSQLSDNDQKSFTDYLSCTDQELFDWLVHQQFPDDTVFHKMTLRILDHAKSYL